MSIAEALEALGLAAEARRRADASDDEARRARMLNVSEDGFVSAVRLLLPEVRDETLDQLRADIDDELSRRDAE